MNIVMILMLILLVVCAIATSLSRNLLSAVVVFMSYSLVMSIIWIILQAPDLAITEAAVGAGVTSILFFIALKKIHAIHEKKDVDVDELETSVTEENKEIVQENTNEVNHNA